MLVEELRPGMSVISTWRQRSRFTRNHCSPLVKSHLAQGNWDAAEAIVQCEKELSSSLTAPEAILCGSASRRQSKEAKEKRGTRLALHSGEAVHRAKIGQQKLLPGCRHKTSTAAQKIASAAGNWCSAPTHRRAEAKSISSTVGVSGPKSSRSPTW